MAHAPEETRALSARQIIVAEPLHTIREAASSKNEAGSAKIGTAQSPCYESYCNFARRRARELIPTGVGEEELLLVISREWEKKIIEESSRRLNVGALELR